MPPRRTESNIPVLTGFEVLPTRHRSRSGVLATSKCEVSTENYPLRFADSTNNYRVFRKQVTVSKCSYHYMCGNTPLNNSRILREMFTFPISLISFLDAGLCNFLQPPNPRFGSKRKGGLSFSGSIYINISLTRRVLIVFKTNVHQKGVKSDSLVRRNTISIICTKFSSLWLSVPPSCL